MSTESNPVGELADIVPIADWLDEHAASVFRTSDSWAGFARANKAELVESGALILGAGRKSDMATGLLAAKVREILLRDSIERLNAARTSDKGVQ